MSRKKKKIAIIGCGWIGNVLKEKMEAKGDEVNCLSRDNGMDTLVGFYAADVLIIAIPPSDDSLESIEDALYSVSLNEVLITQVILLSSISFYDDKKSIVEVEELVVSKDEKSVILRLGGLMGYDRIAGKYTQGKTIEDTPTNYVHRDDVVGIIESVIEQKMEHRTFNVVAPVQSTKKEIFTQNAKQYNFDETHFSEMIGKHNVYTPEILCDILGYSFKKEDVKDFWKD
ncbi:MAG: hypothetical protein Q9M36_12255 [Sulfurovum sp.]|nr:hypothetical protein [Sulfurovum sp.]